MQGARRIITHQEVLVLGSGLTPMNLKRAATSVVVGGALAAWLAAAATSGNREVAPPLVVEPPAVDAHGAELAAEVARLHERLRPDAAPQHTRNLFAFAIQKPRLAAVVAPPAPALTEAPRPPIAPPPLKLVGVAPNAGPNRPELTTMIFRAAAQFPVNNCESVPSRLP